MHHEFFHLAKNISQNRLTGKNALATIVHVQGSAYRREGTRMVIESSGNWFGNISGGCLEGDILRKAKQVIETGENMLVTYDTRESENKEIRVALGCNGIIDILIELVNDPLVELCEAVVGLFENEKPAFLTTHIQFVKGKINVIRNLSETQPFDFPESAFENENLCLVEKSEFNMTLHEYIGLQRKLVIWGSGPDVMPLARFSSQLGWKTVVIADELNILKTLDVENVEVIQSYPDSFLEHVSLHHNTAVILVSHDYYKDYFVLETNMCE
jgi:xanthine dehydrogenase accessory factor